MSNILSMSKQLAGDGVVILLKTYIWLTLRNLTTPMVAIDE